MVFSTLIYTDPAVTLLIRSEYFQIEIEGLVSFQNDLVKNNEEFG